MISVAFQEATTYDFQTPINLQSDWREMAGITRDAFVSMLYTVGQIN